MSGRLADPDAKESELPSPPQLALCIPTRNRAPFLRELLEMIERQVLNGVEVVIIDGASTDGTAEVVEAFNSRLPQLTYVRRDSPMGLDQDLLRLVQAASAQYCWFVGDDDKLEEGAVARVLREVRLHPEISGLVLNYRDYDRELRTVLKEAPASASGRLCEDTYFSDAEQCFEALGLHLGYLSGLVFRRDRWLRAAESPEVERYFNAWVHVYVLGRAMLRHPSWLYVHARLVGRRSMNDSFLGSVGILRRQEITHDEFFRVIEGLFGHGSWVTDRLRRTLLKDRMPRSLAVIKANGLGLAAQVDLWRMYMRHYGRFSRFWITVVPLFLVPGVVFRFVRYLFVSAHRLGA